MKLPKDLRWKSTGRIIGQGGQAQVQEVEDLHEELSGKFALKALAKERPRQAYERFYREIDAIKQLEHPYIVKVVDSSKPDDEFCYYVMELVERARSLQSVLNSDKNSYYANPLESINLFQKICEAISACEKNKPKIVHRDLSPSNVLLVPDGTIRIIDFGLCQTEGNQTITLTDEGVGTVNYMAPECESGAEDNIGIYSDFYSAGKILWSAVTGQRAFAREEPAFTTKTMKKFFPGNPDIWHLHHIFAKTIRHDPANRWQHTKEAISSCNRVRRLILGGYSPIENIFNYCPVCGVGSLEDFRASHVVFGNPNPPGIYAKQCNYCGICLAINYQQRRDRIKESETLE